MLRKQPTSVEVAMFQMHFLRFGEYFYLHEIPSLWGLTDCQRDLLSTELHGIVGRKVYFAN